MNLVQTKFLSSLSNENCYPVSTTGLTALATAITEMPENTNMGHMKLEPLPPYYQELHDFTFMQH